MLRKGYSHSIRNLPGVPALYRRLYTLAGYRVSELREFIVTLRSRVRHRRGTAAALGLALNYARDA